MSVATRDVPVSSSRDITTMRNRLRRFFDEPFGLDFRLPMEMEGRMDAVIWRPAVEATENPMEYLITAELPGISPENIEVSVVDGVLTLKGTKDEERRTDDKERMFHMWEREYGKFERTFRFPLEVEDEKVSAEFTNGVLMIKVPKAKEARMPARTVPIAKK